MIEKYRLVKSVDHEVADNTVENGVFVVAGLNILDEVGHGDRGFLGVQFQDDVAVVAGLTTAPFPG